MRLVMITVAIATACAFAPLAFAEDAARYGFLIAKPSSPHDHAPGALAPAPLAAHLQQLAQSQPILDGQNIHEFSLLAHRFHLDIDSDALVSTSTHISLCKPI